MCLFSVGLVLIRLAQPVDQSTETVKRQIEAVYAIRAQGLITKDLRQVLDTLAPGFKQKYISGQIVDRKGWDDALQARLDSMKADESRAKSNGGQWKNPERVSTVIQNVVVTGNKATVTAVTTTTSSATYPHGLSYAGKFEETTEDTWVKTALGWRLQNIEQIRNRTSTDEMRAKPAAKAAAPAKK